MQEEPFAGEGEVRRADAAGPATPGEDVARAAVQGRRQGERRGAGGRRRGPRQIRRVSAGEMGADGRGVGAEEKARLVLPVRQGVRHRFVAVPRASVSQGRCAEQKIRLTFPRRFFYVDGQVPKYLHRKHKEPVALLLASG